MKTLEEDSEAWNLLTSYPFGHQQEHVDRLSKKAFESYDAFGLHQQGRKNDFNTFDRQSHLFTFPCRACTLRLTKETDKFNFQMFRSKRLRNSDAFSMFQTKDISALLN